VIEKIKIENFQSHSDTEIQFSSNVTVITGKSQSGKTSILRAFRWLAQNRPKGFRFHSYFSEDPTKVEIQIDRRKIIHLKNDKEEKYFLDGESFEGFGFSVPDEILSLLNLSEINIQDQLEEPFLITSSPGSVARAVNEVTNLEQVDEWVSTLTSRINSLNKEISIYEQEIRSFEEKIEKYEGIEKVGSLLKKTSFLDEKIYESEETIHEIKSRLSDIDFCSEAIKSLLWVEKADKWIESLSELQEKISTIEYFIESVNQIEVLEREVEILGSLIDKNEVLNETEVWINKYELSRERLDDLIFLRGSIEELEKYLEEHKKKYKTLLKENGICPTCFSEVDKSVLERIDRQI